MEERKRCRLATTIADGEEGTGRGMPELFIAVPQLRAASSFELYEYDESIL